MSKIAFLDTNIYLHYVDIDQINWPKILSTDAVIIVVPPITIRELNKHKDSHPRTRVRKRAGAVLKKLAELFDVSLQSQLRKGVAIHLEASDPLVSFEADRLNINVQDDNLIASVIMYQREKPDTEIILVTADLGLTLFAKAKQHRIMTVKLPDNLKLPEELDYEQERIRELEQKVLELKLKTPQLSLAFKDGSQHATFTLPHPIELTSEQIEHKITELKAQYPNKREESNQGNDPGKNGTNQAEMYAALSKFNLNVISPKDIAKYNNELDEFYKAYSKYIKSENSYQNLKRRTIKLAIWISNDGTAPAEDIDIFMRFPDSFSIAIEDNYPKCPQPPTPPSPPKSVMENLRLQITPLPRMPSFWDRAKELPILQNPNVSPPSIRRSNSYKVDVHVQRIKHKLREKLEPLFITFESIASAHSFHIDYRILTADLPNEIVGKLYVIIQMEK